MAENEPIIWLDGASLVPAQQFGTRAARLQSLAKNGVRIPDGVAVRADIVASMATGEIPAGLFDPIVTQLIGKGGLISVRASPGDPQWGGPAGVRKAGFSRAGFDAIATCIGEERAAQGFVSFIVDFGLVVHGADPAAFESILEETGRAGNGHLLIERPADAIDAALAVYLEETDTAFPEDPVLQIQQLIAAHSRDWQRPSARILRQAKGAPDDAGLGVILQTDISTDARGEIQAVDPVSGRRMYTGQITERGGASAGIEALSPSQMDAMKAAIAAAEEDLADAVLLEFAVANSEIFVLDVGPARRSPRAELQVAVGLVEIGALSRAEALLKTDPRTLAVHLHPQIAPGQDHDVICRGIAASAGAAQGPIVFSADAAQAAATREQPAILVRAETAPEDIRGMHMAAGVLTSSGGTTSHAAVIAQGIGVPCVVGASELRIDIDRREIQAPGGRVIKEGETLTIDGAGGWVMSGALDLVHEDVPAAFEKLMDWADAVRAIGVRVNADTPNEAHLGRRFKVDGIGLCRTEHMFYDGDRINVMRELILAADHVDRKRALERLMPMQRADFVELFEIMEGLPVTIRLLDPPLHEFLPRNPGDIAALARSMELGVDVVSRRIQDLEEYNPMLGMRGVRLAVTMPEIYEMQARAIFEAAAIAARRTGRPVKPEIMIPLVSAQREVELVKARIDAIARTVEGEQGYLPDYDLGVMVETPRAALRAGDLALQTSFLSFGTNDLTQMTYGLSRDDSGRFMREYVNEGVYPEDPFLTLDLEGVGELLLIAARRARQAKPTLSLGLCGEHGGDPASVRFCNLAGFDYVSCSPFRIPTARLAAAQATLLSDKRN